MAGFVRLTKDSLGPNIDKETKLMATTLRKPGGVAKARNTRWIITNNSTFDLDVVELKEFRKLRNDGGSDLNDPFNGPKTVRNVKNDTTRPLTRTLSNNADDGAYSYYYYIEWKDGGVPKNRTFKVDDPWVIIF